MKVSMRALLFVLLITVEIPSLANELQEGSWSGSYTPYHSNTIDAWYEVQYSDQEKEGKLSIKMIIDLEPRANFTYSLKDIVVSKNKIIFKIKKPQETKSCTLIVQENGDYAGQCQSDIDTEGKHLTEILMIPPVAADIPNEKEQE